MFKRTAKSTIAKPSEFQLALMRCLNQTLEPSKEASKIPVEPCGFGTRMLNAGGNYE